MAETAAASDKKGEYTADLEKLKRKFDAAREGMRDNIKLSQAWRDYYDGKQLSAAQRRVLKLRKQPDVVINRARRAIDGIVGVAEKGKTDPRAYMRNPPKNQPPQSPAPTGAGGMMGGAAPAGMPPPGAAQPAPKPDLDASDVASMTLRFYADRGKFQSLKLDALEYMSVEGTCAAIFEVDSKNLCMPTGISPEEYFWDPHCRKHDFSDKRYDGIAKWMHADDVSTLYPKEKEKIEGAIALGDAGCAPDDLWDDKPEKGKLQPWVDQKQNRLMVVDMYYREGGSWRRCVFHGNGILEEGESIYLDEEDRPTNPIEAQSAYVDRELIRYGVMRDIIDIQDEINARRSKAIHEINTRQVQQVDPNSPPIDVDEVRAEAARPDGVLPPGWQIVPRNDVVANSIEMMQEAKSEVERIAPAPAMIGRASASSSGRADQVKMEAGLTELARVFGRWKDWEHRCYRQMWARARQFNTDPMWIRIAGDDGAPEYVRVNEPEMGMDPMTGQPVVLGVKNQIAKMDVDIVVDSVPDTATLEQEIFGDVLKMAQAYGPQEFPPKLLLELSPIAKHRQIAKKVDQYKAEQAQANAQAMAIQAAGAQAEIQKTQSETAKNAAITKKTEVEATTAAMHGAMEAKAAALLPPGVAEIANLPQNLPPPGPRAN